MKRDVGAIGQPLGSPYVMQSNRAKQKKGTGRVTVKGSKKGSIAPKYTTHPNPSMPAMSGEIVISREEQAMLDAAWSKEMDEVLREGVLRYGVSWDMVAGHMRPADVTVKQCEARWQMVRNNPVKGPWATEEDELLRRLVAIHGSKKWSQIAQQFPGRSGKQCRERWLNHLDTRVKKSFWTEEEDRVLCEAQRRLGNKWSEISRLLPGRAENAVKNRFNSIITKRLSQEHGNHAGADFFGGHHKKVKVKVPGGRGGATGRHKQSSTHLPPPPPVNSAKRGNSVPQRIIREEEQDYGNQNSQVLVNSIFKTLARGNSPQIPPTPPREKPPLIAAGRGMATLPTSDSPQRMLTLNASSFGNKEGFLQQDNQNHLAMKMTRALVEEERRRDALFKRVQLSDAELALLQSNLSLDAGEAALLSISNPEKDLESSPKDWTNGIQVKTEETAGDFPIPPLLLRVSNSSIGFDKVKTEDVIPPPLDIGSPNVELERAFNMDSFKGGGRLGPFSKSGLEDGFSDVAHAAVNRSDGRHGLARSRRLGSLSELTPGGLGSESLALRMSLNSLSLDDDDWKFLAQEVDTKTPCLPSKDVPMGAPGSSSFGGHMLSAFPVSGDRLRRSRASMKSPAMGGMSPMARYLHEVEQIPDPAQRRERKAALVEAFINQGMCSFPQPQPQPHQHCLCCQFLRANSSPHLNIGHANVCFCPLLSRRLKELVMQLLICRGSGTSSF
ncbi:unnamed protein product [Chrysoparadoxa australica]